MPKEKNTPIGEVACPFIGCTCKAQVFKFRERAQQEGRKRFAGRWYSICERKHRCEDQDYLAENANIWGANDAARNAPVAPVADQSAPEPATEPAPVQTQQKPAAAPVQPPVQKSKGWGFFR